MVSEKSLPTTLTLFKLFIDSYRCLASANSWLLILEKLDDTKEVKYLNIQDLNYADKDVFMIFDKWMRKKLQG